MGAGVFYALRDAIRQVNSEQVLDWHSPATVERIRLSVGDALSTSVSLKLLIFSSLIFIFRQNQRLQLQMLPGVFVDKALSDKLGDNYLIIFSLYTLTVVPTTILYKNISHAILFAEIKGDLKHFNTLASSSLACKTASNNPSSAVEPLQEALF